MDGSLPPRLPGEFLSRPFAAAALLCAALAPALGAPPAAGDFVTRYPASFFERSQPHSAFDMLALVPGFRFSEADAEVRGFAGAAGNVLIDGGRPPTKQETLETLLRRIAARTVERIELIRAGATGVDMQGQTVLANVVRHRTSRLRGSLDMGFALHERNRHGTRAAAQLARTSETSALEMSVSVYETLDDEHGIGARPRVAPDGSLVRDTSYRQDESEKAVEFATAYERHLALGKLRLNAAVKDGSEGADIVERRTFPDDNVESVVEFEDGLSYELGLDYARELRPKLQLQVLAIQRASDVQAGDRAFDGADHALTREDYTASESIARSLLRRSGDRLSIEGGLEGALNVLDSHSGLEENGVPIALPAARVRVEELRAEAFATVKLRLSDPWALETELRVERSTLTQSGDSSLEKSFQFVKPRVLLSWSPTARDQWRLLLVREVGQLDFADFVSSSSLASNTVAAGNPALEPDRTTRLELAWERHFADEGALVLTVRHDEISDVIDRIPIVGPDFLFDAAGNIGHGERNELDLALNVPLQRLGIRGGMLSTSVIWRSSRTRDPATGERRSISTDVPLEASAHFWQDVPSWRGRWGIDLTFASEEPEFRFDEVRTDRLGTRLDLFVECTPGAAWHVRLDAQNLPDRVSERRRLIYGGMRGSVPLSYVETRALWNGPFVSLTVRREFGG